MTRPGIEPATRRVTGACYTVVSASAIDFNIIMTRPGPCHAIIGYAERAITIFNMLIVIFNGLMISQCLRAIQTSQ